MPVSKQLDILLALKAQLEGISTLAGDPYDMTGRVWIGRTEFGDETPLPFVSILEAPRENFADPADEQTLVRNTAWVLLIQGWSANDVENPTVPVYELKAVVEKRLARLMDVKPNGGNAKYPAEYRLGGRVAGLTIGPGIVRPPERAISTRSFFYLPVRVQYLEDLRDPFV